MSDAPTTAESAEYEATLIGGNTYTLHGVKYERGVAKPVSAAVMERLKKHAVDHKIIDGEFDDEGTAVTEARQKFKFNKIGEEPVAAPARTRQRATR